MNAWSQLPNAQLIDWVIESVKDTPDVWAVTYDAERDAPAHARAARVVAQDAARSVAWNAAHIAAMEAALTATWSACCAATWGAAYSAAKGSVLALIAYDDSARYLDMTAEQLKIWARLSDEPAAVLLLPYLRVLERIKELKTESSISV